MQVIFLKDRVMWSGNIYEIRQQIKMQMDKYNLVKDLIKNNLN